MSIISVVYVPEGIAMAADSRLTGERKNGNGGVDRFTISDNAQKLFLFEKNKIGISSCGDALINGMTIADFLRVFEIEKIDKDDNINTIANKLCDYLNPTSVSNSTDFFVCGYIGDHAYIYSVNKEKVTLLLEGINYGTYWDGENEAIQKLIKKNDELKFPKTPFAWNLMPLKDGIDLAEFIIDLTIKYQRFEDRIATCGGDIDVLVITKDYARFIKHKILNP